MVRVRVDGLLVELTSEEWASMESIASRCGISVMSLMRMIAEATR